MKTKWHLQTPVAFIIFNRPDTTARVFEEIRRAQPPTLLVVADGPRPERPGEAEKCASARAIVDQIDWPCEVLKNYSDTNLGCKRRVSSGLDWVFQTVEEAIILEDDCLPHPSFFRFCEELLEKYHDDERVMQIGGCNFQNGIKRDDGSYYFSKYVEIWGWATWRRAWEKYDVNMKTFPEFKMKNQIENIFENKHEQSYWIKCFDLCYKNKIDTWDYQWVYNVLANNGLVILPIVNLISNVGFDINATHTVDKNSVFSNFPVESINEIIHPVFILQNKDSDRFFFNSYLKQSLSNKIMAVSQLVLVRLKVKIKKFGNKFLPQVLVNVLKKLTT